ncbi:hypothetical protein GGR92_001775 [Spirosoma lacussanchae]|uniref:alpha-1,2-fucosyltransferase n=1 Tax=Spirosoma lacussanchae TaxID=1884249 RepID=UPI00110876A9|nr:alpha-1,2-fucosyltransferase [Spirosoma lacussanchae]
MIISKITSGLGNQLFQYALARHLSLKNNTPLYFDLGFYDMKNPNNTARQFKLDHFHIHYKTIARKTSIYLAKSTKLLPNRSLPPVVSWVREKQHHFDESVLRKRAGCTILQGYWQSEKYFRDVAATLRQDLVFKEATCPDFLRQKQAVLASNLPVSVHVRRGDYVHHPEFSQSFGFIGIDYYRNAIEQMKAAHGDCTFFVFSDDTDWVKEHMQFIPDPYFVDNKGADSDIYDLELMSLCQHNIIANSSYSWWGAWLNNNTEKTVIAPRVWYRNKPDWNTKDLVPESWVKL